MKRTAAWVLEDNESYRRSVVRSLNSAAAVECTAHFRAYAELERAIHAQPSPAIILLDIGLPDRNGLEVIPEILSLLPGVRVVILTVFDDDEKIFRALCAGASGYLLKTDSLDHLEDIILQAVNGGAPMTPSVARKVLALFPRLAPASPAKDNYDLTPREREVLLLMSQGLTKKEIAQAAGLSTHTVNSHLRSVYDKLHVTTNTGAVAKAIRERLV